MPGGKQAAADTLSKSKTLVSFSSLSVQNELNVEVKNNMANDVSIGLVELMMFQKVKVEIGQWK